MKFSISKSELQNALSIVQKGVSTRSTLPVLSGIFLKSDGDQITFQTTDLELSIQYTAQAMIDEEGATVLPGKLFGDIVKNLPDAAVHIAVDGTSAIITCDNSSFSIKALDAQDFPGFPEVAPEQQITIPFDVFSQMVKRAKRATSRDESRPILTGVLIEQEAGVLRMVATDSYRLALVEEAVAEAPDFSSVISGAFLSDLATLPQSGEDITIALAENQILVSYNSTVFVNRRLEGKFPNYRHLVPTSYETRVVVSTQALVGAVRRAGLLGASGSSVKFAIDADSQTVKLSSVVHDVGSTQETIPAQVEGSSVETAYNGGFVIDGLGSITDDEVALEIQTAMRPGVFKPASARDYLYLAMPVRIV